MTAVVLHLSDIHIKSDSDPILKKGKNIAACLFSSLPSASHVFIVVSGDIAFSGKEQQYSHANRFFRDIQNAIEAECSCPISFIVAPGNHDCDFEKSTAVREIVVSSLEQQDSPKVDDAVVETCTSVQNNFFEFRDKLENRPDAEGDHLWRTTRFEIEGKSLTFDALNVSWVSKLKEDPGRLYFPIDKYAHTAAEQADVRIVIIHHPLNWFNQSIYRPFRSFVRKLANIVISGHEHQGNVGIVTEAETASSAFVEGCALQGDNGLTESAFNVVVLDLAGAQFSTTQYVWNGTNYLATEEGSWADYQDLPLKLSNPFTLTDDFQASLDDPGAFFRHPAKVNVGLSDIFVYPDLRKVGITDERRRVFINSSRLRTPDAIGDGVLIEGEEKSGGTSLLHQLYRHYYDTGFVPLLLKGKDLKKTHDTDIDSLIRRSVETQYGPNAQVPFDQLSTNQKIIFVDGFDRSPLKAGEARANILAALRKRFAYLVVTVGEMFEIHEMLDCDTSRSLTNLEHYKLQHFGHVLRGQLITRWLSFGTDGTLNEANLIAQRDHAERLMSAVMQKNVIPSLPLYLLTLLQSIDAGRSGDFKESALGYYYQYLLTEAFQESGIKADKLTEIFQYAARLAWYFHTLDKRELSEVELRGFNEYFSKQWHTVDFSTRLTVLVKARVLCNVGEDYAFRYPYIYYYLKGKYVSENLSDLDIRAYISQCCGHLYVRDYANTVLFLAHHTTDEFVLNSIGDALQNLFKGRSALRFDGDTGSVSELIRNAPQLTYTGETPADHRTRRNAIQDELDNGDDGLILCEEKSDELSLIAQLTMLFKTTEILGQILKNQYSKIQRARKKELIEDLFDGPLRAIRTFYEYFERNPDALLAEIDAALQKKGIIESPEERKAIAQKVVAGLVQFVTYGFLMRAAQSAGSDTLLEDVNNVVKGNKSAAYKLIELGILLDSPKAIPRQKLKALYAEVQKDPVAGRVMQIMVLNRLYMFKTAESDMQWLYAELDINLDMQHAITYQEKRSKFTK